MPRKAFVADLQEAIGGSLVEGISDLQAGEEDGSFTFVYTPKSSTYHPVPIHALVTDVGDYPHEHQFMLFTTEENPAPVIGVTLNDLQDQLSGVKVCKVVSLASSALSNALSPAIAGHPMDVCDNSDTDQSFEGDSDGTGSYGPFSPKSPDDHLFNSSSQAIHHTGSLDSNAQKKLLERLRTDIRMTKEAGFRVGVIGNISSGCNSYLSVSCRIAKLGISEEAMQAWQLKRQNYLILIIRYPAGYVHADKLADRFYRNGSIEMRVATTSRYKPTLEEATAAFSKDKEFMSENKEEATNQLNEISPELAPAGLQGIFIGRPLNDLLNERLVNLMQLRMTLGFPWEGAEAYFNDHQGKDGPSDKISHTYWIETPSRKLLPPIVTADHLGTFIQERRHKELSFPLLAGQFMLRHTVSCTEFCLVCHSKVEVDFEALKPYVCEKPLCLYQYMTLGMGPSIEFEIISQPNVVDLLVCFCYSAAVAGKLNGFPTGMGLIIPPLDTLDKSIYQQQIFTQPMAPGTAAWNEENAIFCPEPETVEYTANYDPDGPELIFDHTKYGDNKEPNPLRPGDWIVVQSRGETASTIHHRVADISFFPTVQLSHPVRPRLPSKEDLQSNQSGSLSRSLSPDAGAASKTATKGPFPMLPRAVTFSKYERNFDDLHSTRKQLAIILLLSLLPSVTEMKEYLMRKGIEGASLRQWTDRLPPAAVNLLRWIIASNRSCIFEVEGCDTVDQESVGWGNSIADPFQQRIPGFQGCLQFRFAQGAPDKEQRFIRALQTASEKLSLQYESIFAWHGSPMYNWHGIVREGLHFREMQHGRAYGNGCYHSLDYNISAGYCGVGYNRYVNASTWPQSALRISSAVCLNEIVNSPAEFVSREPHLVVAQVDWIQTRYLFVRTVQDESNGPNTNGSRYNHNLVPRAYPSYSNTSVSARVEGEYHQDPRMNPRRDDGQRLIIPLGAIASSRRRSFQSVKDRKNKKAKVGDALWGPLEANKNSEVLLLDDDVASIETSVSDLEILFTDTPNQPLPASPKGKNKSLPPTPPQTDFVPGTLDHSTLPILRAPSDATIHATRWLQRELQAVLKLQKQKPAHELGWYIDSEHIENPYQWILEMHSFDPELPLVKDMRDKGIKSIVLEMRFGKDCPMAPPFVRVIRPRFLPFMQRGGGHVTAGGALCMELLTNSGWSAVSSIESVLLQVRMAMSSTDPFPARLDSGPVRDYGVGEAVDAYIRACAGHGWEVPKDFMSWANPQPSEPPPNPY